MSGFLKPLDEAGQAELIRMLYAMPKAELIHFCQSTLQIAAEGQRVLHERYPSTWAMLDREVEKLL